MTRAVFLVFIYLGLRSELEGNVVWNLTEEQGGNWYHVEEGVDSLGIINKHDIQQIFRTHGGSTMG